VDTRVHDGHEFLRNLAHNQDTKHHHLLIVVGKETCWSLSSYYRSAKDDSGRRQTTHDFSVQTRRRTKTNNRK